MTCGTDQETGLRVGLEDDLVPPPPPRPQGPPLHISIIGGLLRNHRHHFDASRAASNRSRAQPAPGIYAWLALALVSALGIFGCVQLIRGKSAQGALARADARCRAGRSRYGRRSARSAHARRRGTIVVDVKPTRSRRIGYRTQAVWSSESTRRRSSSASSSIVLYAAPLALPDVAAGQEVYLPLPARSRNLTTRSTREKSQRIDSEHLSRVTVRWHSSSSNSGGRAIERTAPDRLAAGRGCGRHRAPCWSTR